MSCCIALPQTIIVTYTLVGTLSNYINHLKNTCDAISRLHNGYLQHSLHKYLPNNFLAVYLCYKGLFEFGTYLNFINTLAIGLFYFTYEFISICQSK